MSVHAGGWWNRERLWQIVTVALLLVILAGATYVRLWQLTPTEQGIDYAPDTDEGDYAFSAQLMLQGELPYRDFFATLPPAGLYLFVAVLGLFYQVWGSLEGFMALRYASALYGVATVLVAYFIGRRLGGRPAGLLAAAVLAIDGIVIFQDRRAMLEAPMNLLSALAVLAYLEANRDALERYVAEHLRGMRMIVPEGTYLAWLDCRGLGIEGRPGEFFLHKARVALNEGAKFGSGGEGFVRINFACPRSTLVEALERIKEALNRLG